MKKKLGIILCLVACLLMSGCDNASDTTNSSTNTTTTSSISIEDVSSDTSSDKDEEKPEVSLTAYDELAMTFFNAIKSQNWDDVKNTLYLNTMDFTTTADLEWVLPRTSLAELANNENEIIFDSHLVTDKDNFIYEVTASCDNQLYKVNVKLCDDNSYKVVWKEAIYNDVTFKISDGITVSYGDKSYISEDLNERESIYGVPFYVTDGSMVKRPITVKVTNALGDTATKDISLTDNANASIDFIAELDNTSKRCLQIIEDAYTLYRETYLKVDSEAPNDEILEYLASDVSVDYISTLRQAHTVSDGVQPKNYELSPTLNFNTNTKYLAKMLDSNTYYVYVQDAVSGTVVSGYGTAASRKDFTGKGFLIIMRYEDNVPKLCGTNGNESLMYRRFI